MGSGRLTSEDLPSRLSRVGSVAEEITGKTASKVFEN